MRFAKGLKSMTRDLPELDRIVQVGNGGATACYCACAANDVVLVTLERIADEKLSGVN